MNDDRTLLRDYVETCSEDAFRKLVDRFMPLVFPTALRKVNGDTHLAEDVTQLAFVALARNARRLRGHPELAGWMFTTTRFLGAKAVRQERRRKEREEFAMRTASLREDSPEDSGNPAGLMDDVLLELKQLDRQVLLLRYYQGLRLADGSAMEGASNDPIEEARKAGIDADLIDNILALSVEQRWAQHASALKLAMQLAEAGEGLNAGVRRTTSPTG